MHFHKKCTKLSPSLANYAAEGIYIWNCESCESKNSHNNFARIIGGTKIESSIIDQKKCSKKSLRILQWNADGITTKVNELGLRLKKDGYDVCLVQETKLKPNMKTPSIEGYTSIRQDRRNQNGGGGLISYIKNTIIFGQVQDTSISGTEASTFRVKMGKRKWATICNIYCPPVRSHTSNQNIRLVTDALPSTPESIVLGDFNAHNLLWDHYQPRDKRGDLLLNWTLDHDLTIMNNGLHTRINTKARHDLPESSIPGTDSSQKTPVKTTEGKSSPDVSICGSTWSRMFSWCTVDGIGSSDHAPISVVINSSVNHGSVFKGQATWKMAGVDWKAFSTAVEMAVSNMESEINICDMVSEFQKALIDAGKRFVGTVKPGRRKKTWETPTVREAIRRRNRLRKQITTRRKEWMEACRLAQETINEAKTDAWRKVLQDSTNSQDDSKMWKVIKNLNGTPETNSPNEAMLHNGRLITCNKKKADIFAGHYASVCGLKMTKENRVENRCLKKRLKTLRSFGGNTEQSKHNNAQRNLMEQPDFTIEELRNAISKMKTRGSPGPDNIPPSFLKNLGPIALKKLLFIFNQSFRSANVPQIWKNAIIVPLLKSGKSASELTSFRPISLTSCVVKVLERMVSDRLYDMAERNAWFSKLQAGFRKGRGVEDQILRITQRIADGFQMEEKSLLVLLDFSKAYDTVWRERLLHKLLDHGVPHSYIFFLRSFLQNRQAKVRFNGVLSKSKKMSQGLPQGSVLAPILFLFYINNLANLLPNNQTISMYADDVSILTSAPDIQKAQNQAQHTVDIVVEWSREYKLTLNGSKSEITMFSNATSEPKSYPTIKINEKPVRYEAYPRLLGVTLDRRLTFSKQVELVTTKAIKKMKLLRAVAHSSWGWRKEDLRKIYLSHVQSVLNFASSSWQPWLINKYVDKLEVVQNQCLRVITTQAKSSPVEALRAETRIPSIKSTIHANCLRSYEKAMRMNDDHPRKIAVTGQVKKVKNRMDFRNKVKDLHNNNPHLNSYERKQLDYFQTRPWQKGIDNNIVYPFLHGVRGKQDSSATIRMAALNRSRELGADINIYTDGSAYAGIMIGGAGVVITNGDTAEPTVIENIHIKGALYTCSYDEEKRAMVHAIDWIHHHCESTQKVAIFTDSQSLCMALLGSTPNLDTLRKKICDVKCHLTIQWIPGHSEIPGNELADTVAKAASSLPKEHSYQPVSYGSSCAQIRMCTKDPEIVHRRTREVYGSLSMDRESQVKTRADQSLLAKLRTGHFIGLRAYKNRVDRVTDPICPQCREEPQDLEHWLTRCPATAKQRWHLFGNNGELACLTRCPLEVLTLARSTLLGVQPC